MFNVDLQYDVFLKSIKKRKKYLFRLNNIENYQIPATVLRRHKILLCTRPTGTMGPIKLTLEHIWDCFSVEYLAYCSQLESVIGKLLLYVDI